MGTSVPISPSFPVGDPVSTTPARYVPIQSIRIPPDRQRQSFDEAAILELAASITSTVLIHAPVVTPDNTLIAGENRLRAISKHIYPLGKTFTYNGEVVPPGMVPVNTVHSDDPLILAEIEWDENTKRKDLTWQEQAQATAMLHNLRRMQKERAYPDQVVAQTVADTAIEVRGSAIGDAQTVTRNEIIISRHLDKPEVAKAPTLKEAVKALKRIEDADRNRKLAVAVGETYSASQHQLFHADCLNWMADPVWAGAFDVILTDPPYGMGAQDFGDGAGRLAGITHDYDDSYEAWKVLVQTWATLAYQVAAPQCHAYVFCDFDRFHELKSYMAAAGWYVFRTPLINYKSNSGRVPLPDKGPRRQYEILLYAIKGDKLTTGIFSDVITSQADEQLQHGAQKPVALYEDLLKRSVKPGDRVLDTFAGTGTIFAAAHKFKCLAVGVEKSNTYYGVCVKRLEDLANQKELPL